MKTIYQEVSFASIVRYYAKDFELAEGTVLTQDWFYSSARGCGRIQVYQNQNAATGVTASSVPEEGK